MSSSERLSAANVAAGVLIALGGTVVTLAATGGITHNAPEASQEAKLQQLQDCADTLPVAIPDTGMVGDLSKFCTQYSVEFTPTGTGRYYLIRGNQFLEAAKKDGLDTSVPYAVRVASDSLLWGMTGTITAFAMARLGGSSRRRKELALSSMQYPLDNLSSDELHRLAVCVSPTYRRVSRAKDNK